MALPTDRRVWLGGAGVAAAIIAAASWFLVISPELDAADSSRSAAAATETQNAVLEHKVHTLKVKSAQLSTYTTELRDALESLPNAGDNGLPAFTRQVTAQATDAHVTLQNVTIGGVAPVAGPAAAPAAAPTDGSPGTGTGTGAASPAAAAAPAAGALQMADITLKTDGTFTDTLTFLKNVQYQGPRRALVNSTQLTSAQGDHVTATVQLSVFSAPQSPQQIAQLDKLLAGDLGH
ncbi:MAG TPA: hypothetical protein VGN18_18790 [Jatrophihabitans sp.]|jgi:hypothetical protein|uniref:hypothetical protein n=1 Tax=Jatrophihabitans sp. TaxID=1932789 RepID=UPI002E06C039|nr:hypothetical protein [Jatrophihabitans sp.]